MVIYKTTNLLNNKIYIGKDSKNRKTYLGSGKYFKRAIKRYGKENFSKEIICVCASHDELNKKEIYYIELYDATNKRVGYNLTKGGSGTYGYKLSDKSKKKISLKRKEFFKNNPEAKVIKSNQMKEYLKDKTKNAMYGRFGDMHPAYGKKITKDRLLEMSKRVSGKKNPMYGKTQDKHPRFLIPTPEEIQNLNNLIKSYYRPLTISRMIKKHIKVTKRWIKLYIADDIKRNYIDSQKIDFTSADVITFIRDIRIRSNNTWGNGTSLKVIANEVNKKFNLNGQYKISEVKIKSILKTLNIP